jgi:PTH1 family peptidyl-tRNA hydrolase
MFLIVGLGNPGSAYTKNRHNVGFQAVEYIAERSKISLDKKNMNAHWGKGTLAEQEIILAKPQTFMNLSGRSVGEIVRFYKLEAKRDLLVICDDLDLPVGRMRIRPAGSSGGQNGLKSIIEALGTPEFARLRIGIGRPSRGEARDHVLNDFSRDEAPIIAEMYGRVADAVELFLTQGLEKAMNRFNGV